jgi:hypothetical protein
VKKPDADKGYASQGGADTRGAPASRRQQWDCQASFVKAVDSGPHNLVQAFSREVTSAVETTSANVSIMASRAVDSQQMFVAQPVMMTVSMPRVCRRW